MLLGTLQAIDGFQCTDMLQQLKTRRVPAGPLQVCVAQWCINERYTSALPRAFPPCPAGPPPTQALSERQERQRQLLLQVAQEDWPAEERRRQQAQQAQQGAVEAQQAQQDSRFSATFWVVVAVAAVNCVLGVVLVVLCTQLAQAARLAGMAAAQAAESANAAAAVMGPQVLLGITAAAAPVPAPVVAETSPSRRKGAAPQPPAPPSK